MTDQDFSKLRLIIREEVGAALEEKLDKKLDEKLTPIHKKLNKIERDLKATNHYFDNRVIGHEKRITKIEAHLNISSVL